MKEIVLDGLWNAEARRLDDNPSMKKGDHFSIVIPGDVRRALVNIGTIPDPDVGLNAAQSAWTEGAEWTLRRKFTLEGRKAIYYKGPAAMINNTPVSRPSIITAIARRGDNSIEIECGNDTPSGIRIYETDEAAIISLKASSREREDGRWEVEASFSVLSAGERNTEATADLHGQVVTEGMTLPDGVSDHKLAIIVENPELWHPNGYGYPHLYQLSLRIGGAKADCFVSLRKERKIAEKGAVLASLPSSATIHDYEHLAKSVAEANMNVLYTEKDEPQMLYDAAERYGIYVRKMPPLASVETLSVLPSPPSMSSVLSFAPLRADLSLSSPVMEAHEAEKGDCRRIEEITTENFRLPSTFEKGTYLSELYAALDAADKVSRIRARREAEGIILRTLNDKKPQIAGTLIESSGKWKIPMYAARLFFAPVCPLMFIEGDTLFIYVANDSDEDIKAELSLKFRTFEGKKKDSREYPVSAKAMSSVLVDSFPLSWLKRSDVFCYAKLSTKNLLRERNLLLAPYKEADLSDPGLRWECRKTGQRTISIRMSADKPAFYVTLNPGKIKGIFSDNMISVRPSAEKTVIFRAEDDADEEEFEKNLKVYDLYSAMH